MNDKKKTFLQGMLAGLILLIVIGGVYFAITNISKPQLKKSDPIAFIKAQDAKAAGGGKSAPGIIAPDFTVEDVRGGEFSLSDFRGNPVIVEIFSTWCGVCISETDDFRKLLNNYPKVSILSIDIDPTESNEDIKRFIRAYSEGFDNWFYARDTDSVITKYGSPFTGTTIIINGEGKIVYRDSYSSEYDVIANEIEKLGLKSENSDSSETSNTDYSELTQINFSVEVSEMKKIFSNQRYSLAIIDIKGMTCPSCIKIVKDNLKDVSGVVDVALSLEDAKGAIIYDASLVSVENDIINNKVFSKYSDYEWSYSATLAENKKI